MERLDGKYERDEDYRGLLYYEIDKKDYEESWPQVKRVSVKAIFYKNMKYLFFHNVEKDYYVLPCKEIKEAGENPLKFVEELAEKLIGADITSATQTTLGQGKVVKKDEYAEQQSVEMLYVYKLIDLDKIPYSTERMNSNSKDGFVLRWIDLEKSNPEKRGRKPENFDGDFDMAVAEYNGIVEDIGKWLGDKMTADLKNMLDGPGMINPAYYTDHQIPVKEVEGEMKFMGMGGSPVLNHRIIPNENTESSTVVSEEKWICSCRTKNKGKYCKECGNRRPVI